MDVIVKGWNDYEYVDSGDRMRLERVGPYTLCRPAPQALWKVTSPGLWKKAHGIYTRSSTGGGSWNFPKKTPQKWIIDIDGVSVIIKPTGFGHFGLFPEQKVHWHWLEKTVAGIPGARVLNLFAYTGVSTLFLLRGGAHVTHVDASRGVVSWAREHVRDNGLKSDAVRWIVEDAVKFVKRESNRGASYDGIVMDPPSFGRGPKGSVFKFEKHIVQLLDECKALMSKKGRFFLFTCHTPGISPPVLTNLINSGKGSIEAGHMNIKSGRSAPPLPCGIFARWSL